MSWFEIFYIATPFTWLLAVAGALLISLRTNTGGRSPGRSAFVKRNRTSTRHMRPPVAPKESFPPGHGFPRRAQRSDHGRKSVAGASRFRRRFPPLSELAGCRAANAPRPFFKGQP